MLGERFVHRLEAFSDIVIGFSLAQLGATLVIPHHAAELISHPEWLGVFAWTFALVCLMWWGHNRIFRAGFVATPAALVLNFVLLATIVLLVYFAQVLARATAVHDIVIAGRFYFGSLAMNALISAWLYRISRASARAVTVSAVSGAVQLAVWLAMLPLGDNPNVLAIMGVSVPVGFVLGGVAGRRVAKANAPA